jgi:hypothetical protein
VTSPMRSLQPRLAPLFAATACAALAGAASLLGGCPGSSTAATYTPYTGVNVPASEVLRGHRCGNGPDDVYRYSVVVWYGGADGGPLPGQAPLYSGIWDCFTDAVFENLPAAAGGSTQFFLRVYAYTAPGLPAALDCPGGIWPDGAPCAANGPVLSTILGGFGAQWETSCTATQLSGVPITAVCGLLAAVPDEPVEPLGPLFPAPASDGGAAEAAAGDGSPDAADAADAADAPVD